MKPANILITANSPTAYKQLDLLNLPDSHKFQLPDLQLFYAPSLDEAATYLKLKSFDLILLNLDFKQANYRQSLDQLVTAAPRAAVVVVCPPEDEQLGYDCLRQGAVDFFTNTDNSVKFIARVFRYALEGKQKIEQTLESSNIDPLTGLANRSGFMSYIGKQLQEAERLQFQLSLFFVDCDNFKVINDTLGQSIGDDFLAQFANQLKHCVRCGDFLARLSADEFVVVINTKDNKVIPSAVVAEKILASTRLGVPLSKGGSIENPCSIGITHYDGAGPAPNADHFLQEASSALAESKKKGGNCLSFFDTDLGAKVQKRNRILKDIRMAFKRCQFSLNYQPIIEATTDRVKGYEALLRWTNEKGQSISPMDFVPILEENGMIHVIGAWVIGQACHDFKRLIAEGAVDQRAWMSVNISPMQIQHPNFVNQVTNKLSESDLAPGNLHLEITESSLIEKTDFALQTLGALRSLGCHLSLDDFGVGYSSMNYLKELPIDTLKIDQSFVRYFDANNESDSAILRAMISLAHNLGKSVVAEGVETTEAATFLKQRRCEFLQGYLYAKPMPFDDLLDFTLQTNRVKYG